MKALREEELVALIADWVRNNQPGSGSMNVELTEKTDLVGDGLLDSMGFIELMVYVEQTTGRKIDLSEVDPSEFTRLKGFCRCVLQQNDQGA
jgi:acyl carrier protein